MVEDPVEPEHDRQALARAHRRDDGGELAGHQVAELEQFLDDLARGEPARRGGMTIVPAEVLPDHARLTPERAHHLREHVDDEPELPLHRPTRYRGACSDTIAQAVQPLSHHFIARFRDHTSGGEQRRRRSAHGRSPC
jgi:hypothetical protein